MGFLQPWIRAKLKMRSGLPTVPTWSVVASVAMGSLWCLFYGCIVAGLAGSGYPTEPWSIGGLGIFLGGPFIVAVTFALQVEGARSTGSPRSTPSALWRRPSLVIIPIGATVGVISASCLALAVGS